MASLLELNTLVSVQAACRRKRHEVEMAKAKVAAGHLAPYSAYLLKFQLERLEDEAREARSAVFKR